MGVKGLWDILSLAAQRRPIQELKGKKIGIDASIWIIKLMHSQHALRSDQYYHLILESLFKRILKLLKLQIKPVFVFDGPAPELKIRTIQKRKEARLRKENELKKMAEKFLVAQIRGKQIKIENQNQDDFVLEEDEESYEVEDDYIEIEFDIMKKNPIYAPLLPDNISFSGMSGKEKVALIQKIKDKARTNIVQKQTNINDMTELSNQQLEDYINILKTKYSLKDIKMQNQKNQNIEIKEQLFKEHETIGRIFKNIENPIIYKGTLASDHQQSFLVIKNKYENQNTVNQKEKIVKRQTKNQKRNKFVQNLQDLALQRMELIKKQEQFDQNDEEDETDQKIINNQKELINQFNHQDQKQNIDEDDDEYLFKSQIDEKPSHKTTQDNQIDQKIDVEQTKKENIELIPQKQIEIKNEAKIQDQFHDISINQNMIDQLIGKKNDSPQNIITLKDSNMTQEIQSNQKAMLHLQDIKINKPQIKIDDFILDQQNKEKQFNQQKNLQNFNEISQQNQQNQEESFYQNQFQKQFENNSNKQNQTVQQYQNISSIDMPSLVDDFKTILKWLKIPFIESPSETDPQLAFLNHQKEIDYVISSDNDLFLYFAIKSIKIEKNHYILYDSQKIESQLGLSQQKLRDLCLLLGGDYSDGVKGIGIVNAMEVVEAFEGKQGLEKFYDWAKQSDILRTNSQNDKSDSQDRLYNSKEQSFIESHKMYKESWVFEPDFPSEEIYSIYENPIKKEVTLGWGEINWEEVKLQCRKQYDWNIEPWLDIQEETLDYQPQPTLDQFGFKVADTKSDRLQNAIRGMRNLKKIPIQKKQQIQDQNQDKIIDMIMEQEQFGDFYFKKPPKK